MQGGVVEDGITEMEDGGFSDDAVGVVVLVVLVLVGVGKGVGVFEVRG